MRKRPTPEELKRITDQVYKNAEFRFHQAKRREAAELLIDIEDALRVTGIDKKLKNSLIKKQRELLVFLNGN
ncbi:MAG: hypothetical protein NUV57_03815 [archaeon]|nr:hypothetical protein [archaeon]